MKNTKDLDESRKAAFKRKRIFCAVLTYASAILALVCLIGIILGVLMLNFGTRSAHKDLILLYFYRERARAARRSLRFAPISFQGL